MIAHLKSIHKVEDNEDSLLDKVVVFQVIWSCPVHVGFGQA